MMKKFKLKTGKPARLQKPKSVRAVKLTDPAEEPPFYIKGQVAASRDEYWTSLALTKIEKQTGWTWDYQVSVEGGRSRRGGQVVDFLLYNPPRPTIIDVRGKYWHTGSKEDLRSIEDVARKRNWRLIGWFTDETPSKEAVYARLRQELHL